MGFNSGFKGLIPSASEVGIFLLYLTASRNSAPAYYNLNILFMKFKFKPCWNILQKHAVTCTCENKNHFILLSPKIPSVGELRVELTILVRQLKM